MSWNLYKSVTIVLKQPKFSADICVVILLEWCIYSPYWCNNMKGSDHDELGPPLESHSSSQIKSGTTFHLEVSSTCSDYYCCEAVEILVSELFVVLMGLSGMWYMVYASNLNITSELCMWNRLQKNYFGALTNESRDYFCSCFIVIESIVYS